MLRYTGALMLGKTRTTEFVTTVEGPETCNAHDLTLTPTWAALRRTLGRPWASFQAAMGLGAQTGGSAIRPGSFNGPHVWLDSLSLEQGRGRT